MNEELLTILLLASELNELRLLFSNSIWLYMFEISEEYFSKYL